MIRMTYRLDSRRLVAAYRSRYFRWASALRGFGSVRASSLFVVN